ncbi:hypothetical protein FRB98_009707, partial [Tulasnella sp. 332]
MPPCDHSAEELAELVASRIYYEAKMDSTAAIPRSGLEVADDVTIRVGHGCDTREVRAVWIVRKRQEVGSLCSGGEQWADVVSGIDCSGRGWVEKDDGPMSAIAEEQSSATPQK